MKRFFIPFFVAVLMLLSGCREQTLLTALSQEQANEVMSLLLRHNIAAEKKHVVKEGYAISVTPADFTAAVDLMTIYQLPSRPDINIADMFPADAMVSSPRAEVARIFSGIEQRLAQSLKNMEGVIGARVHVSYDISNTDVEKRNRPVNIAVLLTISRDVGNESLMTGEVKRFLKNSFASVRYDDISVVLTRAPVLQQYAPVLKQASLQEPRITPVMAGLLMLAAGLSGAAGYLWYRRRHRLSGNAREA